MVLKCEITSRGYSWEFVVTVCCPFLQILTRFQTQKCNFPHPFSDQTSKIHTRFQTWPLGRNYVIITQIRVQTKKFFKSISKSHIFLSYSFGIERSYNPVIPSKTIPYYRPKWAKCIPSRFQTKTAQKSYLMGDTYLYSLYKGVPPRTGLALKESICSRTHSSFPYPFYAKRSYFYNSNDLFHLAYRMETTMETFSKLTETNVRDLVLSSAKKTCMLDLIPTPVVVNCLDVLLPVLTKLYITCL